MSAAAASGSGANGVAGAGDKGLEELIEQIKPTLYDWTFNVFELAERTGGRPLYVVTMALLEDQGLLDGWKLDRTRVSAYLAVCEARYKAANPYHNNTHAADVTQTAAVIMRALHAAMPHGGLTRLERFALILGSAVHDLAHPGVNNDFLVRSRDALALSYNDRSVNENMHAALAFETALAPRPGGALDIFEAFDDGEFRALRKLIINIVLSTDMGVHFELLDSFRATAAAALAKAGGGGSGAGAAAGAAGGGNDKGAAEKGAEACTTLASAAAAWPELDRNLLLQMAVHLADLANPARPFPYALRWAERVITEFLAQGEREAAAGLSVSAMCDPSLVRMPKAQLNFIGAFLEPTLDAFRPFAPAFGDLAAPWLADTKARWAAYEAAGVVKPDTRPDAYPAFPPELGPPRLDAAPPRLQLPL